MSSEDTIAANTNVVLRTSALTGALVTVAIPLYYAVKLVVTAMNQTEDPVQEYRLLWVTFWFASSFVAMFAAAAVTIVSIGRPDTD